MKSLIIGSARLPKRLRGDDAPWAVEWARSVLGDWFVVAYFTDEQVARDIVARNQRTEPIGGLCYRVRHARPYECAS